MPYTEPKASKSKKAIHAAPDPEGFTAVTASVFQQFLKAHPPTLSLHQSSTTNDGAVTSVTNSYVDDDATAAALLALRHAVIDATPLTEQPALPTSIPVDHGSPFVVAQHIGYAEPRADGSTDEYMIRTKFSE